jgi:hypothetical protein
MVVSHSILSLYPFDSVEGQEIPPLDAGTIEN